MGYRTQDSVSVKMIFNKWINFSIYVLVIFNFCCPNHLFSQNSTQQKWVQNNIKYSTQLREAKKSGNRDSLVTAYLNLGNLNLKQNGASRDYEKSKNFFKKALSKIDSSDIKTRALCFEKLGDCARYSASTLAAIKNYDKAFEYYFTLKNFDKLGLMLHRKGDCILDQKNYILAKKNYLKAIEYYQKNNNVNKIASCTSNIGEIYMKQGQSNLALKQFQKAYHIVEDLEIKSYIQFEIGKMYIDSLHLPNRDSLFINSLNHLKKIKRRDGIGYAHLLLGKTYLRDGKHKKSKTNLIKGTEVVKSIGADYKILMGYQLLIELNNKEKNYKEALRYTNLLHDLEQKIYTQKKDEYIKDVETKYRVEKKNNEIAKITSENIQIEAQKNAAHKQRNIIVVFVIILSILIITLIVYQIKLRKSNKDLVEQKEVIQEVNYELEKTVNYKDVLLKEVHHRVKNNLQVICSILEMQADSSKNNKLKDKLQTSMDRVFSMALVHEQLYASDTNEYIDAREYLHEIVSAVMASQKNMAKEVAINLSIDEVKLPLNIALPLGMILNELISNAFKYAFKTTQKGLLKLSLKQKDDAIIIFISDNGPGMDTTNKREKSIGLQIANDFMYQLKGTLKTFNNNGTNYELYIPLFSNKK